MGTRARTIASCRPEILGFLRRRLWNREEAEDLCQETLLRGLKASAGLRDPGKLRPYLLRIANNLLINHLRRGGRVVPESALGEAGLIAGRADEAGPDPAAALEAEEFGARLRERLARLPADQRLAFERGVLQREPYAALAADLGWSLAKVKVTVFRARRRLMAELTDFRPSAR